MSAEEIVEQIRRLPEVERHEVVERIANEFIEFDAELTPEQIAELDRRAEEALAHPERCRPAEEVFAEIRTRLVTKQARVLPLAEQIELCRNLLDEIAASKELTPGEAALIDSRLRDHLDHPDDVVSLEEVRAKLDAKYSK